MNVNLHPKARQIEAKLRENGIKALYHFTDIHNLSLILQCGGLWSKEKLEDKHLLSKVITGGNELSLNLDRGLGNWDKVHLYFCPYTPMAYYKQQEKHICYLMINSEVALRKGVVFTDTNATRMRNEHQRAEGIKGLNLVDFNIIKLTFRNGPQPWNHEWHRKVQAEVLVPDEIPLRYIMEVVFISEASRKEGERLWGTAPHPPFRVSKKIFTPGIPYLDSALLTEEKINKDIVEQLTFSDQRIFRKSNDLEIFLLLFLYSTAGLKAKAIWRSSNGKVISEDETEFDKQSGWWHWPSLNASDLRPGSYSVEYYLGDIYWITVPFILKEAK